DPVLSCFLVDLEAPSIHNQEADVDRLVEAVEKRCHADKITIDWDILGRISPQLREWDWKASVTVRGREIIAMAAEPSKPLGLAVDLGTTKIAAYLMDLETGQVVASQGIMNPQIAYGEDVIARIARVRSAPRESRRLRESVVNALNELADELCTETGLDRSLILETVLVGNTAMHHLFSGLPVAQLAAAPYVPAVRKALEIKARDLGLTLAPGSYVHLLPNIAGFVGADHVAALLATGVYDSEGITLVLDIGTNTEVCLSGPDFMTSVSCASGPAFEGAHIEHGMRAANGAIEHVRLTGGQVEYQTIGGIPPVGLCGSGILDALAQLYATGVLDAGGRMGDHARVRSKDGKREYVLVSEEERDGQPALTITQKDVRQLQLAKAAMQGGIRVLLENHSLSVGDIDRVLVAGAFGSYIDIKSAMTIGILPHLPTERVRQVGNAAGIGAQLALVSRRERARAQEIARRTGYIEMASLPGFQDIFTKAIFLGPLK
ncbi:MAG: DUF4445 domain-containing protein, partial [Deltaproteobacteria bacterium]|nr:DUF4445 domain-containing protein [Deltaproteobacteria bacterium]